MASFHSIVAALLLLLLPIGTRAGDSAHPSRRMDGGEDAANTLLQRSRRRRARAPCSRRAGRPRGVPRLDRRREITLEERRRRLRPCHFHRSFTHVVVAPGVQAQGDEAATEQREVPGAEGAHYDDLLRC